MNNFYGLFMTGKKMNVFQFKNIIVMKQDFDFFLFLFCYESLS